MTIKLACRVNGKVVVYLCETMDYEEAIETVRAALKEQGEDDPVILAQTKPKIIISLN